MKKIIFASLACLKFSLGATTITWIAEAPENDLTSAANWSTDSTPSLSDTALFNSTLANVALNPTDSSANFTVSAIQFSNQAAPFSFAFNNRTLAFSGSGLLGANTNAHFTLSNVNNSDYLNSQLFFGASSASLGSALWSLTNQASNRDTTTVGNQLWATGTLLLGSTGSLFIANQASDASSGNNGTTGVVANYQLLAASDLTLGANSFVSLANSGTYSGNGGFNTVGRVQNHQLDVAGTFTVDEGATLQVSNQGNNSASGSGGNYVGELRVASQVELEGSSLLGNNVAITVSNQGTNSCSSTSTDYVGYLNDYQFHATGAFQTGSNFSLEVTNIGVDSSTGNGQHIVAGINSNSGDTGNQVQFEAPCNFGSNARIAVSNQASYSGTNTVAGPAVGIFNQGQLVFKDQLTAADGLTLSLINSGIDSGVGVGNDAIAPLSGSQLLLNGAASIGDNASFFLSNSGQFSGSKSSIYNNIGSVANSQFKTENSFQAGNNFHLSVLSEGNNSGSGGGAASFIGCFNGSASQVELNGHFQIGDGGQMILSNQGVDSNSSTSGGDYVSYILGGYQFVANGAFQTGNNFTFSLSNSAKSIGQGQNYAPNVSTIANDAARFNQGFSLGKKSSLSISNSSFLSGSSTGNSHSLANMNYQLYLGQALVADDSFSLQISNCAQDSSSGLGNDVLSQLNRDQCHLQTTASLGNNGQIAITNQALYSGSNSTNSNVIGNIGNNQFWGVGSFVSGEALNFTVSNSATCSSNGSGNYVGNISGAQLNMGSDSSIGGGLISVLNSANNSGSGINNLVGTVNSHQALFAGPCIAGALAIQVSNEATNSGDANNSVGNVAGSQLLFQNGATLGHKASFLFSNKGTFSGVDSGTGCLFALVENQLSMNGLFSAGDHFSLQAVNAGSDSGQGGGGRWVASLPYQVSFLEAVSLGEQSNMGVANRGNYTGSNDSSTPNSTGVISANQLLFTDSFSAGEGCSLVIDNKGFAESGSNNNLVGTVAANQLYFMKDADFLGHVSCFAGNEGVNQGSGAQNQVGTVGLCQVAFTDSCQASSFSACIKNKGSNSGELNNQVGVVADSQLSLAEKLQCGGAASFILSNVGEATGSGNNGKSGCIANYQLFLPQGASLGSGSALILMNQANYKAAGSGNQVGVIGKSQLFCGSDFTAGPSFVLNASNYFSGEKSADNQIAEIQGPQVLFQKKCQLGANSYLSLFNQGTVKGSQLVFDEGFEISSGPIVLQTVNEGVVEGYGIEVLQGSGGDARIGLGNSSLYVTSPASTFTIGALAGDASSFVQSKPALIIDTDAEVVASFAGVIENFAGEVSTLTKQGKGVQILAGNNTFSGKTAINEGTLVLNGSLAGDLEVNALGLLKGNGTVAGEVVNRGTISPGLSIGTLSFLKNFANEGGTYFVEVNSKGECDLLLITESALLAGGNLEVSLEDGIYLFHHPYTVLKASLVTGKFSSVKGLNFSPLVRLKSRYNPQEIEIMVVQDFEKAARTHNQEAVAKQLDSIHSPSESQNILFNQMVNLPLEEVRDQLSGLSGYQHTEDFWLTQLGLTQFFRRLYDPLRTKISTPSACLCRSSSFTCDGWFSVEGGGARLKGNKEAAGLHTHSYEITGGLQREWNSCLTVGFAGAYSQNQIHYKHGGSGKAQSGWIGAFALFRPSHYYAFVDVAGGYSANHLRRSLQVGLLPLKAKSHPEMKSRGLYAEAGFDLYLSDWLLQPFLGWESTHLHRSRIKEKGAQEFGLSVEAHKQNAHRSRAGVHLSYQKEREAELSLDLAWNYLFSDTCNDLKGHFLGFGKTFRIEGLSYDKNSIDYALSLTQPLESALDIYLELSGEASQRAHHFEVTGGLDWKW